VRGRKVGSEGAWKEFASASAAARKLGLGFYQGGISAVASGKVKQTGGWVFEWM